MQREADHFAGRRTVAQNEGTPVKTALAAQTIPIPYDDMEKGQRNFLLVHEISAYGYWKRWHRSVRRRIPGGGGEKNNQTTIYSGHVVVIGIGGEESTTRYENLPGIRYGYYSKSVSWMHTQHL